MAETRIEHDSMGDMEVPADALWGASTQRAVLNFPISGQHLPRRLIWAGAAIKQAAAEVNAELQLLDTDKASAISAAAARVADGEFDDQFPIDVYQTGSGTSSNMNFNEVIAHLATQRLNDGSRVHPNDDVNLCQSSNDVFPTAIQLAGALAMEEDLVPGLERLRKALTARSDEFWPVVKTRPHTPAGRDPGPARPGVPRLPGPGRGGDPSHPRRSDGALLGPVGRDRGRYRRQLSPRVCDAGLPPGEPAHRPPHP